MISTAVYSFVCTHKPPSHHCTPITLRFVPHSLACYIKNVDRCPLINRMMTAFTFIGPNGEVQAENGTTTSSDANRPAITSIIFTAISVFNFMQNSQVL